MKMQVSNERLDAMAFANEEERYDALSGADREISLSAHDQYFRAVEWMEPLSHEERQEFLQRVIRGNMERRHACPNQDVLALAWAARERLVEVYQPLVIGLARRRMFRFGSMELLDVIQEGSLGLLEALERYDEEKSRVVEFGVFAATCIKSALGAAVNERDVFIRLSWPTHNLVVRKTLVAAELRKRLGHEPSLAEIAEVMQVSEEALEQVETFAQRRRAGSLQAMLETREIAEDVVPLEGLYAPSTVAEDARQRELASTFERVFAAAMPQQQREVLELRYGFGDVARTTERSTEVIRDLMGLKSPEHVVSSERRAMHRLKNLVEGVTLPDGRLSCSFHDVYGDEYCTSREAAELLHVSMKSVEKLVMQGELTCELHARPHTRGTKIRYFKKADVLALKEQRATAPVTLSSRRRESASLKQARRSALLPAIVA